MEGLGKTTAIIIEFLVGGLLVISALGFLALRALPEETAALWDELRPSQSGAREGVLAVMSLALAYGVGMISEFVAQAPFEFWLHRIEDSSLKRYLSSLTDGLKVSSPILSKYVSKPAATDESGARLYPCIGEMRFYILMKSRALYSEVESQLSRIRLVRVFLLAEVLVAIGLGFGHTRSVVRWSSLGLVAAFVISTLFAMDHRFRRYVRAIERGYKAILLEEARVGGGVLRGVWEGH